MKVVVVGGGTAGWFTAAYLKKINGCDVTLVESPTIKKIGVGESVTPHVYAFFRALGFDESEWMLHTGAVYKFANKFIDWVNNSGEYQYFSFSYSSPAEIIYRDYEKPFEKSDLLSDYKNDLRTTDIMLSLMLEGRYPRFDQFFNTQFHYMENSKAPFIDDRYLLNPYFSWSHHINAEKAGDFVRDRVALPLGVNHVQQNVSDVIISENGIEKLILENGEIVTADLFVDASGFHRVLTKHFKIPEIHYKDALVDSAWVCQLDYQDPENEMVNYTQSIAQSNGWMFKIGLYHRMGTGYVFSSSHVSEQTALDEYLNMVSNRRMEPRLIKWKPSRLQYFGQKNFAAIGLSMGFVEPLEANSLFMIAASIFELSDVVKNSKTGNFDFSTYNEKLSYAIDDIADFIRVHYTLSNRRDTEFWKDCSVLRDRSSEENLLREKYFDPRNSFKASVDNQTLFPEYMWIQLAHSWNIDYSSWKKEIPTEMIELGKMLFDKNDQKHKIVSGKCLNNFQWLKQNRFCGFEPDDWAKRYL